MFNFPYYIEVNGEIWERGNRFYDPKTKGWGWVYAERSGMYQNIPILESEVNTEADLRMEIWLRARLRK